MSKTPRVVPFGERAVLLELGDRFDPALVERARQLAWRWTWGPAVPAYTSVVLQYEAHEDLQLFDSRVEELLRTEGTRAVTMSGERVVEIPVRYDGPDLADVAALSKLSVDEVVALHSGRDYDAYFLGYLPGWAYCGPLDTRIRAPRLESPRPRIAPGTVAVADGQTGVYPFPSPGGWRLIGSTDAVMFDPAREPAALIRPGSRVRFVPR